VHLGIATNLDEYLVVPVIREAQRKNLEETALELNQLVEKAHARKLTPSELTGSTFTISNLGMLGIQSFTAIINPPEAAILAVGKIQDTVVPAGKEPVIRPMMTVTVAVDHRVVDGAQAAKFLGGLKEVLENPYLLI
jgi:pyruvate dehydrogenase E2 component (dihydrolipoamide acetyltransferase)